MALVYRLVKGTPLTAAEYDANLSELDTKASPATIRAEVESELVAGSNITITPGSSGATRTLTIASTGGSSTTDLSYTASTRLLESSTGADVTLPLADGTNAGLMASADFTKLSGIAAGAEVNVNADWNAGSGDAQILNKPTLGTAAAAATTDFAPAAQGVTNGNSHDHSGGDGAQIAYSSLSGLPSLSGTNTGDQTITNSSDATSHTVTLSSSGGSLQLVEGSNITLTTTGTGAAGIVTIASTGGGGNTFSTVAVSGQSNVVADTTSDTLTLVAGSNITITTDAGADSVTIAATGGGTDQPLYFDAADFIPRTTNGCGISSEETATNRINRDLLAFDAGAIEYAQKGFVWPEGWATATCTFFWKASSGTGSCVWAARMRVFTDADAEDQAMGTAQSVTDAAASANTHRQTAATAAITPGGTVTSGRHCIMEVYRDATNGSDDLSVDALLIGVALTKAS